MLIAKPISGKVIELTIPEMTFLVLSREAAVITDVESIWYSDSNNSQYYSYSPCPSFSFKEPIRHDKISNTYYQQYSSYCGRNCAKELSYSLRRSACRIS